MMLTTLLPRVVLFGACLVLGACSSITVTADYDPDTDFSGLRTFAWIPDAPQPEAEDPRAGDPLASARVTEAVERTLAAAGYEQVSADADFLVGFSISVQSGTTVTSDPMGGYYGRYGRYGRHSGVGYGYGYGGSIDVYEYEEGVLLIDVIGAESATLLWRGTAKAVLGSKQTPEKSIERINEAVDKIFAQFPPR